MKNNCILIVDDDARVLFVLRKVLRKLEGTYNIVTVSHAKEALQQIKRHSFDLLLTDLRLPQMDGIQVTRAFLNQHPDASVIWMTAYGCAWVRQDATQMGVYDCLNKPVGIQKIRATVLEALELDA